MKYADFVKSQYKFTKNMFLKKYRKIRNIIFCEITIKLHKILFYDWGEIERDKHYILKY